MEGRIEEGEGRMEGEDRGRGGEEDRMSDRCYR